MKVVNYSELRQNLKANLDAITDNEAFLIVQRPKGRSVVMMSLAEYNALQETMHLNKSKTNRQRLENAIENINAKTNLLKHNLSE
jgi:antitoxin YefM